MDKRIIKLHHPTGHPYWQSDEFKVEMPNGEFLDVWPYLKRHPYNDYWPAYKISVSLEGDISIVACNCSSGGGKHPVGDTQLLVSRTQYDELIYVGEPLLMSDTLKQDLIDNPDF